ncbi:defective proboscis extension response 3 isoform 2-T2 [Cochliomyia hominivorax]
MTFANFSNVFNATTTAAATKTLLCSTALAQEKTAATICQSIKKCKATKFSKINSKSSKIITKTTTTTTNTSHILHLYPCALKRKIRKTSRRKRKRRRTSGCLLVYKTNNNNNNSNNNIIKSNNVNIKDNIQNTTTTTKMFYNKYKLSVNNTRTTTAKQQQRQQQQQFHINKKRQKNSFKRKYVPCLLSIRHKTCHKYLTNICDKICGISCCCSSSSSNSKTKCCNCSCYSCSKKISLIKKNIVTLLLPQKITSSQLTTANTLLPATSATTTTTTIHPSRNNNKRKKVQLYKTQKQLQQQQQHLKYLYDLGKCVNITQKHEKIFTTTTNKLLTTNSTLSTKTTTSSPSSLLSSSSTVKSASSYFNSSMVLTPAVATLSSTASSLSSCCTSTTTSSPSSSLFRSKWFRLPYLFPAPRIFNELYGVIFMTLLVLSICHNNVLETSAASVKIARRDVVASSAGAVAATANVVKQTIVASSATEPVRLNERQYKRQHPPEHISQQQQQQQHQLPQTHNHHQPQQQHSYASQEVVQQQKPPLENEMEEDKSNHIFQPPIPTESLPVYQQHEREQQLKLLQQQMPQKQQKQQQHSTTQAASFSHGMALETTYNHTFQSLSIIDGGLTVAVDTSQNLMTVEEEMLVAAAGGALGVGSNAHLNLGNHLHNSNNALASYDSTAMGIDGFDMMTHNAETNSMPIFDFGMPRNITARTGHTEAVIKCRVDRLEDKSVSWIRKRDLHILTVGTATYTSDKRFQVTESKDSREWTLHVKSPQARDSGIYECQVNTEPKMSMAFQLNVIEISPDAKAVITGPADLHFKVGSAIILTCIVHQPSVKDIGPIYWYRGEYMITPFDINDNTQDETVFPIPAGITPSQTTNNKVNVLEQNHHQTLQQQQQQLSQQHDGIYGAVGNADTEQISQILTNEITQDFAQRIAMESQLGDTMKSRLRISNAQTSDTGNYTCQPTTASSASVMVHVINDENPAAMQKSGASSFHGKHTKTMMMPFIYATIVVAVAAVTASKLNTTCNISNKCNEDEEHDDDVDDVRDVDKKQEKVGSYCCCSGENCSYCWLSATIQRNETTTKTSTIAATSLSTTLLVFFLLQLLKLVTDIFICVLNEMKIEKKKLY